MPGLLDSLHVMPVVLTSINNVLLVLEVYAEVFLQSQKSLKEQWEFALGNVSKLQQQLPCKQHVHDFLFF